MSHQRCCVRDCYSTSCKMFRFPDKAKCPDRFEQWIRACGNKALENLSPAQCRNRKVCEDHFESRFLLGLKLATTAVPTLNLPDIDPAQAKLDAAQELISILE